MPEPIPKPSMEEEEKKAEPVRELEAFHREKEVASKKAGYALPPIARRQGDFDYDLLRDQQDKILKQLNSQAEAEELGRGRKEDPNAGKSMKDLAREKREAMEQMLEQTKTSKQESVEERKTRLQAQRDILVKMKKEQREKELSEFKTKTGNREDLHKELSEMDQRLKLSQGGAATLSDLDTADAKEVDRRLEMYRRMRQELLAD